MNLGVVFSETKLINLIISAMLVMIVMKATTVAIMVDGAL